LTGRTNFKSVFNEVEQKAVWALADHLDPERCDDNTFRYSAEFAMIQIETGLKRSKLLIPSEFGLVTQAYYQSVGGRAKIDWRRLNGKFN